MANINGTPEHSTAPEGRRILTEEHTPAVNGHGANGHEPNALFWRHLLDERDEKIVWLHPPVPIHQQHDERTQNLLGGLANLLHQSNPYRAWLLQWTYRTRAAAAQQEMEDVEREALQSLDAQRESAEPIAGSAPGEHEARLHALQSSQVTLETALVSAHRAFAQAASQAGLIYDTGAVNDAGEDDGARPGASYTLFGIPFLKVGNARHAEDAGPDEPSEVQPRRAAINPQLVERALRDSAPSLEDMAGQHGISPAPEKKQRGILERLFETLAPLVSGFMLALCLGTLVGLVDLRVLRSAEVRMMDYAPLLGALVLGSVLVYLMGELVATAVHSLASALELREEDYKKPAEDALPRLRGEVAMAWLFLISVMVLGAAEITAEAIGLRTLHLERIRSLNLTGTRETTLSLWLYFVIGLLISGPYLLFKAAKAWNQSQLRLREAWLVHKQLRWLAERRQDVHVQEAFRLAYRVEQLEAKHNRIRRRLDEARAAAVGETARLHQMVEAIVAEQEPSGPHGNRSAPDGRQSRRFLRQADR